MKILLDPGHGAGNRYNRGFKQVDNLPYCNEGDCNFIYCRDYLKPALEKYGVEVEMTRKDIKDDPSLAERGKMAKDFDLLISCHSNAANGLASGVEIWDSTNTKESIKPLTDKICISISKALGIPNRGTRYRKQANGTNYYGVLRSGLAKHNFIIEHCFHDNWSDVIKYRKNLNKVADVTAKTIADYFKLTDFIPTIVKYLPKTANILPSITIAQAILESDWGRSELAQKAYNFFGIKASKEWNGKVYTKSTWEQREDGVKYEIKADFRKYNSISESIIDHDNFFVSTDWRKKNYKRVLEASSYKEQALALRACGYATDLNYSSKLIRLIEEHKLYKYDKEIKMDKVSSWAKEAWDWAKEKGITDGSNPQGNCTREQVIVMLKRYDEMIRKEIENEN